MKDEVAVLAEAGRTVGTGHLLEALSIVSEVKTLGVHPLLMIPPGVPAGLLARAMVPVEVLPALDPAILATTAERVVARGVRVVVTNFREVSAEQISAIGKSGLRVICIDEFGGRHLNCTAVINPSPVPERHRYTSDVPGFRIYGGPEYLALAAEYLRCHSTSRHFAGDIRSLVIAMGGVDRTGATLRIVEALGDWKPDVERHLVLGAAFPWDEKLERLLDGAQGRWRIYRNLPCLVDLLMEAGAGISAGGNTLCEMACVGTPAIVLHEDPHEAEQGHAFEARGFGVCLGSGTEVTAPRLRHALDQLEDPGVRRAQSESGKRLVDGRGASRIGQILMEQLANHSPVAA